MELAIIAITSGGARLARRLGAEAAGIDVFLPVRYREEDGCRYFPEPVAELLPELFRKYRGLVCIMATGIVVRVLAPHLRGKQADPAVVVMDEAGRFAVSLLSGHLGGANELALELAELTGGQAVVTTATDVNGLPAWDDVARQAGLGIEPVERIRHLNTLLLEGKKIALVDRDGVVAGFFEDVPGVSLFGNFAEAMQSGSAGMVFVTHRHLPGLEKQSNLLVLRPRDLVVGIGCNRGTSVAEIEAVVTAELEKAFLCFASVACLATITDKTDEEGIHLFARRHGLSVEYHVAEDLNRVEIASEDSEHALAAVGAKGVCEPAAILSAGGGPLLVKKKKSGNVTVAVAQKQ